MEISIFMSLFPFPIYTRSDSSATSNLLILCTKYPPLPLRLYPSQHRFPVSLTESLNNSSDRRIPTSSKLLIPTVIWMNTIIGIGRINEPGPDIHNGDGTCGRALRRSPSSNSIIQRDNSSSTIRTARRCHRNDLRPQDLHIRFLSSHLIH